ncbi:MAG: GNAT family N-acetyltransferase [Iamia sp.]
MSYRVEPLADHDLATFDCGHPDLDRWLADHAHSARGQGTRTYVLVDDDLVRGYFAIAPHLLDREHAPPKLGRGAARQIPAILLAKLALDRSLHGQALGSELLVFALRTILDAAARAGGRIVVVDAIDDAAASFYVHHDFEPIPNNPRRLVMKLSTAARALGVEWP